MTTYTFINPPPLLTFNANSSCEETLQLHLVIILLFITLAGFPPAIQSAGMDLVTTLSAAMMLRAPMVTPFRIMQRVPMRTSSSMTIGAEAAVRESFQNFPIISPDPRTR